VQREQGERRNNAIAFAVAFNDPKELDNVLPPPKPTPTSTSSDPAKFVQDRWWG